MSRLRIEGAVERERELDFADLAALPGQIADVSTLVPGRRGGAVHFRALVEAVGVRSEASEAILSSSDGGFEQTAPLAALGEALLVYRLGGAPLAEEDGGPIRFLVPNLEECLTAGVDRCTNVKRLVKIRIT